MLIAKYMFDPTKNADALPTFYSGYEYTVEDMNYSETFDTYNNVLPSYYGYDPQYHSPIILSDGTLRYVESYWDWYSLDVTEYVNKQVTVSFDVSCVDDGQSWRKCEGWITGYEYDIGEGVTAGSEPKHISYTNTLLSNTFDIQGASIKLTNIQIMVEGVNLFDTLPGFNSYFICDDYDPTRNDNTACKVNNELWFTYSSWTRICYDITFRKSADVTVSFDINKLDVDDDLWIEFVHSVFNTNVGEYVHYGDIVGDMYSAITDTIHVETRFTLGPGYNGYYVLEGMNGLVSNFKIEVQSPYKVRSIYSDTSPTSIAFNNESTNTSCVSVEYLDVSNITDMSYMFDGCTQLIQLNTSNWDTSKVTDMSYMFRNCTKLIQLDLSNFDTSNVVNMTNMFNYCSELIQLNISDLNTSKVVNMSNMFRNCSKLTQLDVSNFDTSSAKNMSYMFAGCSEVSQLDVRNFDTSEVTTMTYMFYTCSQLAELDISSWDTSNLGNMNNMFRNCTKLIQLDLSNFDTSGVTNMTNLFRNCTKLIQLDLSNFDTSRVTNTTDMFTGSDNLITIGMIYCSLSTINTLSSLLPTTNAKQVYVHDVSSSECAKVSNITFIDYIGDSEIITPPRTLLPGDELLWDDSSQRYIIKCSDGTTIQTDIASKFKIDLYTPYTMIYADNATSISVNIKRKEM